MIHPYFHGNSQSELNSLHSRTRDTVQWDELLEVVQMYLCSGDNWSIRLTRPSIKLLSLSLVNLLCEQHVVGFRDVHDVFLKVMNNSYDQCYYDGMVTAIRRFFCCKELHPAMQHTFQIIHNWFCVGEADIGPICHLLFHFTSKRAVIDIYNFVYQLNFCHECPYKLQDPDSQESNSRIRRQYSVRTFLNTLIGVLEAEEIPMDPQGRSVLLRQYLIVLGDLARCFTRDMMTDDWF